MGRGGQAWNWILSVAVSICNTGTREAETVSRELPDWSSLPPKGQIPDLMGASVSESDLERG